MFFSPFIIQADAGKPIDVIVDIAEEEDLEATHTAPEWQTNWTSEFLSAPNVDKFAVKALGGELIALAAYQILGRSAYVYILYAESAPHSNPTMNSGPKRKYYGI